MSASARNLSNRIGPLTDAAYARLPLTCRYCGLVLDTAAKSNGPCPAGRRHFGVAPGPAKLPGGAA